MFWIAACAGHVRGNSSGAIDSGQRAAANSGAGNCADQRRFIYVGASNVAADLGLVEVWSPIAADSGLLVYLRGADAADRWTVRDSDDVWGDHLLRPVHDIGGTVVQPHAALFPAGGDWLGDHGDRLVAPAGRWQLAGWRGRVGSGLWEHRACRVGIGNHCIDSGGAALWAWHSCELECPVGDDWRCRSRPGHGPGQLRSGWEYAVVCDGAAYDVWMAAFCAAAGARDVCRHAGGDDGDDGELFGDWGDCWPQD